MEMDFHDMGQWLAMTVMIGTIWWRFQQRAAVIAAEAKKEQELDDRLTVVERRLDSHTAKDDLILKELGGIRQEIKVDMRSVRERLVAIETQLKLHPPESPA